MTGEEMRRMMEIIREQEHPLPEMTAGKEADLLPRVTEETVLARLRRHAVQSLRRARLLQR